MKSYNLAAAALLGATLACLACIGSSLRNANQAVADLATDQQATDMARAGLAQVQKSVTIAQKKSEGANQFLEAWTPQLDAQSNIEAVFGKLDTLAVNNLLSPSGKNFQVKPNYFFNGEKLPVENVNITVAGEYSRTVNWLGAVEAAFPLGRVEQISYTMTGNSLALAAQFVFPKSFDTP